MVLYGYDISEEEGPQKLFFSISNSYYDMQRYNRYNLVQVEPLVDGEAVPFTYQANPGVLKVCTDRGTCAEGGTIEMCYDGVNTMQIRSTGGLGVRFFIKTRPHELFIDRLDGSVCASFALIGSFLWETLKGAQTNNARWDAWSIKADDGEIIWTPDKDGETHGYIHYAETTVEKATPRGFDDCVKENWDDFYAWAMKYEPVPDKYAHIRLFAIYVIWSCYLGAKGMVKTNMVFMMRNGPLVRAMGWHQSYHAMALWKDLDTAIDLLYSMFSVQDEFGMLPDSVSDHYVTMLAAKPVFQGFALSYILDRVGIDALTPAHCEKLYEPMKKWAEYWFILRDRDRDGIPSYMHADESGWDDASIFRRGMPTSTPDLCAFLVLMFEAIAKLAARMGKHEEARAYDIRSKELLDTMIKVYWNGAKFVCFMDTTREVVDEESIAVYQPIILGKRLPEQIRRKIGEAAGNTDTFFMPAGFASESQQSRYYDVTYGSFMLGTILAPVQLMMTVGLYNAGEKEVALKNAYNWCERSLEVGPQTIVQSPPQKDPRPTGFKPVLPPFKGGRMMPGFYSSWGAAVFLVLGAMLYNDSKADKAEKGVMA
jgi:hypothetical protein